MTGCHTSKMNLLKQIQFQLPTVYKRMIVELGLLRKRNECAVCFKKINKLDYNIQMCERCRMRYLAEQ